MPAGPVGPAGPTSPAARTLRTDRTCIAFGADRPGRALLTLRSRRPLLDLAVPAALRAPSTASRAQSVGENRQFCAIGLLDRRNYAAAAERVLYSDLDADGTTGVDGATPR
jgi:hypothetical protein